MCGFKKLASGVFPESWKVLAERRRRRRRRWRRKRTKNNKSPGYPGWLNENQLIYRCTHLYVSSWLDELTVTMAWTLFSQTCPYNTMIIEPMSHYLHELYLLNVIGSSAFLIVSQYIFINFNIGGSCRTESMFGNLRNIFPWRQNFMRGLFHITGPLVQKPPLAFGFSAQSCGFFLTVRHTIYQSNGILTAVIV